MEQPEDEVSPSGHGFFRQMPSQPLEAVQSMAQLVRLQQGPFDQEDMESQLRRMHKHVTLLTGELSVLHSEVQRLRVFLSNAIQAPGTRELASLAAIATLPPAAAAEDSCGDALHGLCDCLQKLSQDSMESARDRAEILGRVDALSQVVTSFEQLLLLEVDERTSGDKRLWHALNNHMHTTHTLKVPAPEDGIWRQYWKKLPMVLPVTASPPLSPSTPRLATPLAPPFLRSSQSTPTLLSPSLSRT